MVLSFKKQHLKNYRPALIAETVTEEAGDVIVPDSWPDAEQICGSSGTVVVRSKECTAGKATVSGSAKIWVMYHTADNEVKSVSAVLPYAVEFSDPFITDSSVIMVVPRIVSCEGRVINSRKLQVKASICAACTVMNETESVYCHGIETECGIEVQYGEYPIMLTKTVKEKSFTISDELQLESGKPGFGQLLAHSVGLKVTDKKLVGTKLVFKGEADIDGVYLSADGNVESTKLNLPFSQIIDIDDAEETDIPWLGITMTSCELEILDDYSESLRRLELNMNVLAQAAVSGQQVIKPVLDFYSTEHETSAVVSAEELTSLLDIQNLRRSVRERIAADSQPVKILNVSVALPKREVLFGNGHTTAKQNLEITVIYLDENGIVKTQRKKTEAQAELELSDNAEANVSCELTAQPLASVSGGDIEVNFELEFCFVCTSKQTVDLLADGEISDEIIDSKNKPSAVLARAEEDLWHIAKKYGAKAADIKAVNGIEDENIFGKMILIPKPAGTTGGI